MADIEEIHKESDSEEIKEEHILEIPIEVVPEITTEIKKKPTVTRNLRPKRPGKFSTIGDKGIEFLK